MTSIEEPNSYICGGATATKLYACDVERAINVYYDYFHHAMIRNDSLMLRRQLSNQLNMVALWRFGSQINSVHKIPSKWQRSKCCERQDGSKTSCENWLTGIVVAEWNARFTLCIRVDFILILVVVARNIKRCGCLEFQLRFCVTKKL